MADEQASGSALPPADTNPVPVEPKYAPLPGKPPKKRKSRKKLLIIIIVVIILALVAAASYTLLKPKKAGAPATSTTSNSNSQSSTSDVPTDQPSANTGTTAYTSPASYLNLAFSYPKDWTVDPPSGSATSSSSDAASGSGKTITVMSPRVTIKGADNQSITGRVVVKIRDPGTGLSELNSKSAVAAQDSVQFGYVKPTASQHQYPYLTFIHYNDQSNVDGAFEEVIVTGVNQFKKGAILSTGTIGAVDPLITAQFFTCSDTSCTGSSAKPLAITNATWTSADVFKQTQALFESLQLN